MTIAAARLLGGGTVCFVGIGKPSTAANLARRTHAPGVVLVYESGCIGAEPARLPLSIGDGELATTADALVSVPEIHPGATVEDAVGATGWDLRVRGDVGETAAPTAAELAALRDLIAA